MNKSALTFAEIEKALDAGKLEMVQPWGAWVIVRRRAKTKIHRNGRGQEGRNIPVWMENEVEAFITTESAQLGYPDVRVIA